MNNLKFFTEAEIAAVNLEHAAMQAIQERYILLQMARGVRFERNYALLGEYRPLQPVIESLEKQGLIKTVESETKKPKMFFGVRYGNETGMCYWYEVTADGHKRIADMLAWYYGMTKNFEFAAHVLWSDGYIFGVERLVELTTAGGETEYLEYLQSAQDRQWEDYRIAMIVAMFATDHNGQIDVYNGVFNASMWLMMFNAIEEIVPDGERIVPQVSELDENDPSWVSKLMYDMQSALKNAIANSRTWEQASSDSIIEDAKLFFADIFESGKEAVLKVRPALEKFIGENRATIVRYEAMPTHDIVEDIVSETVPTDSCNGGDWSLDVDLVYVPGSYMPYYQYRNVFWW